MGENVGERIPSTLLVLLFPFRVQGGHSVPCMVLGVQRT